jgi:uncharacterized protein (DUF362 family)
MEKLKMSPRERVAVVYGDAFYCSTAPYNPDEAYPEYPFGGLDIGSANPAYRAVRNAFHLLEYDRENFGSPNWNPLGKIISPGMTVVLKPNWVLSRHQEGGDLWSVITHPSVIRAIADYVLIALKDQGELRIIDAPQYNCNFSKLVSEAKLDTLVDFLNTKSRVKIGYGDLRNYWSPKRHHFSHTRPLTGDPNGFIKVNLSGASALNEKRSDKFYGAVYHRAETISAHSGGNHVYSLAKSIYCADVVISIPKLKVHKKVGVTLNAKGLVGSTANKNQLVHYSLGSPSSGGDQYPDGWMTGYSLIGIRTERWMYDNLLARRSRLLDRLHRFLYRLHDLTLAKLGFVVPEEKRILDAGNWHGNDSAWRMTADLYRALVFSDSTGKLHSEPQRTLFSVVDGIIGGENRGPLVPDAKRSGVIVAGSNLLAVDIVATRVMGFDPRKLKLYNYLLNDPHFDLKLDPEEIDILSNNNTVKNCLHDFDNPLLNFLPHPGWMGFLEVGKNQAQSLDFDRAVKYSLQRSEQARQEGR